MKIVTKDFFNNYKKNIEEINPDIYQRVREIINKVINEGDKALYELTYKFDNVENKNFKITVSDDEIENAERTIKKDYKEIYEYFLHSIENIKEYHSHQKQESWFYSKENSLFGQIIVPIEKVGAYVPGGKAFYPSSIIMNVVPALIAGVPEIYLSTPPDNKGNIHPLLIMLSKKLGVKKIFKIGGAQAIAAFAYGTETIPKVYKITGPGNIYVAIAKQLVMGKVGIDSIAGPSEVAIVADESVNPEWVAVDLCSQAEHGGDNETILICFSENYISNVIEQIYNIANSLPRKELILNSIKNKSFAVKIDNINDAFEIINKIAPEHVEFLIDIDIKTILSNLKNSGAVFYGKWTPVATGDYYTGPNHVIPTSGTSVFSSSLGVYDFIKRISISSLSEDYLKKFGNEIISMSKFEKLDAHGLSISKRINE